MKLLLPVAAASIVLLSAAAIPASPVAATSPTAGRAALSTSTITGFITTATTVRVGGEAHDTVTISPGAARRIDVQYRRAGSASWTVLRSTRASSTGTAFVRLTPPAAGTWYFRLLAPTTTTAAQVVTAARRITASGTAYGTDVTGFSTTKATVRLGTELDDRISITPRGARVIEMQRRPYGSGAYTTVQRLNAASGTLATAVYLPTKAGTWQYRVFVLPDRDHRGWISPPRTIVVPQPTTPRIYGWPTTPASLRFGEMLDSVVSLSVAENEVIGVLLEGRPKVEGSWGSWITLGQSETALREASPVAPIPGIGTWQVRIRTLPSVARNAATTPARTVTVASPECAPVKTFVTDGITVYQCTVLARTGPSIYAGKYVFHYSGDPDLSTHTGRPLIAYFHADLEEVEWTTAPSSFVLNHQAQAWALQNDYVWLQAVSPLLYQGVPAWGLAQGLWHRQVGQNTGIDVAAIGKWLNSSRYAYDGYSGGSWFMGEALIPAGLQYAPGPVVMNCGASSPWPPEASKYPPFGYVWTWWPAGNPSVRQQIPIRFNYGTEDPLLDAISFSKNSYQAWGFTTTSVVHPGGSLCSALAYDADVVDFLSQQIA